MTTGTAFQISTKKKIDSVVVLGFFFLVSACGGGSSGTTVVEADGETISDQTTANMTASDVGTVTNDAINGMVQSVTSALGSEVVPHYSFSSTKSVITNKSVSTKSSSLDININMTGSNSGTCSGTVAISYTPGTGVIPATVSGTITCSNFSDAGIAGTINASLVLSGTANFNGTTGVVSGTITAELDGRWTYLGNIWNLSGTLSDEFSGNISSSIDHNIEGTIGSATIRCQGSLSGEEMSYNCVASSTYEPSGLDGTYYGSFVSSTANCGEQELEGNIDYSTCDNLTLTIENGAVTAFAYENYDADTSVINSGTLTTTDDYLQTSYGCIDFESAEDICLIFIEFPSHPGTLFATAYSGGLFSSVFVFNENGTATIFDQNSIVGEWAGYLLGADAENNTLSIANFSFRAYATQQISDGLLGGEALTGRLINYTNFMGYNDGYFTEIVDDGDNENHIFVQSPDKNSLIGIFPGLSYAMIGFKSE